MEPKTNDLWSIPELIDLEILILEDEKAAEASALDIHKQDRAIYLEIEKKVDGDSPPTKENLDSRLFLFRRWFEKRRVTRFRNEDTPGEEIISWFQFWAIILFILGAVSAITLVQAFYGHGTSGENAPQVNVVWFGWVCLVPPFLLTLCGFMIGFESFTKRKLPRAPAFLRGIYKHLLRSRLEKKLREVFSNSVDQDAKLRLDASLGTVKAAVKSRRGILSAYLFLWIQSFALGYALALPLFTYANGKWVSHDFSWQSTFASSPEVFHRRISWIATPWAWCWKEGHGYPSIEQIRATEYIKRDPLKAQPKEAWAAWGMYLFLAALFYVTLPRLLLFAISFWRLRVSLGREEIFHYSTFDPLFERMTSSYVVWGREYDGAGGPTVDGLPSAAGHSENKGKPEKDVCILALANEFGESVAEATREYLKEHKHWGVTDTLFFSADVAGYESLFEQSTRRLGEVVSRRFILVEEAGTPPVIQFTNLVKDLRRRLGESTSLVVALLGESSDDALGAPPPPVQFEVWEKTLKSLGDPRLRVVALWN